MIYDDIYDNNMDTASDNTHETELDSNTQMSASSFAEELSAYYERQARRYGMRERGDAI